MGQFIVLIAILAVLYVNASASDLPLEEGSDYILKLLQNTYGGASRTRTSANAGDPLILTKYIEENKLKEAREAAYVNPDSLLPDMDSYAGYFTVNKKYNANLWMWYFPVADQPVESTPWIIWLQGGPGASSMYGLFTEIGPFKVNEHGTLEEMKYSWGKTHSLLFIDNPVGTGYSFTGDKRGYATNQTTIGEHLYDALQQFLTIFPELRTAPLTIAGESYAGKHIPSLAIQIHRHRNEKQPINMNGVAIGNGFIDPLSLQRYSYFVREVGLVDDHGADRVRSYEEAVETSIAQGDMIKAYKNFNYVMFTIMGLADCNIYNYLHKSEDLGGEYSNFIQEEEIRKALHVGNTEYSGLNGLVYNYLASDFMNSAKHWLEELIQHYKVMCYNGHLDIIVAYHPSVNTYLSLKFPGSERMHNATRYRWYENDQLTGYIKTVGNFSDVMVLGAGHMVPADQPSAALGLIMAFTGGEIREEGYLVNDEALKIKT